MSQSCSACGTTNAAGAKFCRGCGAKVEAAVAPVAAAPVPAPAPPAQGTCPQCGKDNLAAARFCRHCGGGLPEVATGSAAPAPPAQPDWDPAPAPRPRPIGLYLLGGIAALGAIGAAGWFGNSLIAPAAPAPTEAVAVASPAVTGPFESIKFERFVEENSVYSAQLTAKATPTEVLAEARRYCLANAKAGCFIILVANGRTFPSKEFLDAPLRQTEDIMERLIADGTILGAFGKHHATAEGNLELNCGAMPAPANEPAIRCRGDRFAEDAGGAATDAAAAATAPAIDAAADAAASTYYLVADANLRNRSTAESANNGKLSRGTMLAGSMIIGEDGKSSWLKLANGKGYVSAVNLSASEPPQLTTIFGVRGFKPEEDLYLYANADTGSALVDTIPAGTTIVITGITGNGFVEAKGRRGGVGYFPSAGHNLGGKR